MRKTVFTINTFFFSFLFFYTTLFCLPVLWCLCAHILRSYKTPNRHASVSLRRLCSSIRIALTSHGTKSNSVLSLNELAVGAARWDCIWGMLIYQESGSGDVVIKDSISHRSVWCDHTLPLTDGVSLTSALRRYGCHKQRHQQPFAWSRESGGLNIPVRVKNSFGHGVLKKLCYAIKLFIHGLEKSRGRGLQQLSAKPWNAAI